MININTIGSFYKSLDGPEDEKNIEKKSGGHKTKDKTKDKTKYKNSESHTSIFISDHLGIDIINIIKTHHNHISDEIWDHLDLILKCLSIDGDFRSSIINIIFKNDTILLNYSFNPSLEKDNIKGIKKIIFSLNFR